MSNLLLDLFAVLLAAAAVYSLRQPGGAVALAVATYGLKQIATISMPFVASHPAAFNIGVAAIILAAAFHQFLLARPVAHTRQAWDIALLVWSFLALFWASSLWAPGGDPARVWRQLPYFMVYVFILPSMVPEPERLIRSFRVIWAVLVVGLLGTLSSPSFVLSAALGRAEVVAPGTDPSAGANPLAFADTSALLALTSLMLAFVYLRGPRQRGVTRAALYGLFAATTLLGVWGAFVTGRGETLGCVLSGIAFAMLIVSPRLERALAIGAIILAGVALLALLLVVRFHSVITTFSPRFNLANLAFGVSARSQLQTRCFSLGTSTIRTTILGVGAGACQNVFGSYPHTELLQALVETGLFGFTLLCTCYFFALRFGLRTLRLAQRAGRDHAAIVSAFLLSLMLYSLMMANKKGTLWFPDSYMWLLLGVAAFDRARASMQKLAVPANPVGAEIEPSAPGDPGLPPLPA